MSKKYLLSNVNDLQKLKEETDLFYDEIEINTKILKYNGTLRYAIKYAFWKLKTNGVLKINDEVSYGQLFSTKRIDIWQIKNVVFKMLGEDIALVKLENNSIIVKKIRDRYINNGVSFGLIFSGNVSELELLENTLNSILDNKNIQNINFEVLICGPINFDLSLLKKYINHQYINYLPYNLEKNERFMINKKKSFLYENMQYNIAVISHLRIYFSQNFITMILKESFDFISPKILDQNNLPYLGFTLIGSYDVSKKNPYKPLTGIFLNDNFYYALKKRVPYIDGGLLTFNKNIIKNNPFDENLGWGEGEDIDIAAKIYYDGYLIDFQPKLTAYSAANKIKVNKWKNLRIFKILRNTAISIGLY